MNRRSLIRKHVADLLKKIENLKVFENRLWSLDQKNIPAAVVRITSESSETESRCGPEIKKTANLIIEVYASAPQGAEQEVDQITSQIEEILQQDRSLGDLINHCDLVSTELRSKAEGCHLFAVAEMRFQVTYFTIPADLTSAHEFDSMQVGFA